MAILDINNDWGTDTQKFFQENFEKRGGKIVAAESFFQGEKDFTAVLTKLKQSQARRPVHGDHVQRRRH